MLSYWHICSVNVITLVKSYQMCYPCSSYKINSTSYKDLSIIGKNWKKSLRKIMTGGSPHTVDEFSYKALAFPKCKSAVTRKFRLTMLILFMTTTIFLCQIFSIFYKPLTISLIFRVSIPSAVCRVHSLILSALILIGAIIKIESFLPMIL